MAESSEQSGRSISCHDFQKISCVQDDFSYVNENMDRFYQSCCGRFATTTSSPSTDAIECCKVLHDNVYSRKPPDWDGGSYQAYVMGVAVVAILLCLFISGARSVRKRRMMMIRERQRRALEGYSANVPANHPTDPDPPTYGELEAHGLTKEYKGEILPPPYPGVPAVLHVQGPITEDGQFRVALTDSSEDMQSRCPNDSTESMQPPAYTPR